MNFEKALQIVKPLSDGVNPFTGEVLPDTNLLQNGDIVRALTLAVTLLQKRVTLTKKRANAPEFAGLPWSSEEDTQLVSLFDAQKSYEEIAQIHKRTLYAIEARLAKLGKIEMPEWQMNRQYSQ